MYGPDRYRDAAAFRRALEQRLRTEATSSGVASNRLRKEAAFNRILIRLQRVAIATFGTRATMWPPELLKPPDDWAGPWAGFAADYPLR